MISALKFLMEQFLLVDNFDQVERDSETIEVLGTEMVDILLNSAVYYQKKYEGQLEAMHEVFPGSPLKKEN